MGPSLNHRWSIAGDYIKKWVQDGFKGDFPMPSVDVRDVATAHLQAILKPDAAGKRFLLIERNLYLGKIFNIILEMIPSLKFDKIEDNKEDKIKHWDNTTTKEILGIPFISYENSVKETVQDMIDNGALTV